MPKPAAYQLSPQVWRIPAAPGDFVNIFVLLGEDGQLTLVDTGTTASLKRATAGLASLGKAPQDVTGIVLTHAHGDHAGSAAKLVAMSGAPVSIHETDAPWARDGMSPPRDRSTRLGRVLERAGRRGNGFPKVSVGEEFTDGQLLPIAGGLRVVHTPGHTPGHVALLHEPSGVLITGDSIWNFRRLRWSVRAFCTDIAMNERTAHVLGELDYRVAAFTHGPHITEQARERVRTFVRQAAGDPTS